MHGPGLLRLLGWRLAVVACLLRPGGGELHCFVEEKVCYQGANIAVDFSSFGSSHQGCREVDNAASCCETCAALWPQCLSWQYILEGTAANGYPGMNSYCCLKGELAPDPVAADFCESGYQNPRCFLTSACAVEVTGTGFTASDSLVAIQPGHVCGDAGASAAAWAGITNPQASPSVGATTVEFALGAATGGAAGRYPLCYGAAGSSVPDHTATVGVFSMRGPDEGQNHSCTLGQNCELTLSGTDFTVTNGNVKYKVAVIDDPGDGSPCGSGSVLAGIEGIQNPDNVEDNDFDDTFNMETPTAGSTLASYAVCWANDPSDDISDYVFHVGSFTLNGPEAGAWSCVMGRPCDLALVGTGLATSAALLLAVGADELVCAALVQADVADLGAALANPSSASSASPDVGGFANFSLGVPGEAHANTPGSGYRMCFSASPAQDPPAYDLGDYSIDVGTFTLHGPVFQDTSCVLTAPCLLTFAGSGLGFLPWGLRIVGAGEQCGTAAAGANVSGGTWASPASGSGLGEVALGTATAGPGTYAACWGAYPSSSADYSVAVGAFSMHGPTTMTGSVCTKGLECTLVLECPESLSSCGLANTNRLLLLDPGSSCGSASAVQASFSPMATDLAVNDDGVFFRYELGFADVGTARDGYTICWGADPDSQVNYSYTIGDLSIAGANNFLDMSCTLGLTCQLVVDGNSLASTNRIIVLGSGDCGDNENNIDYADLSGLTTSQTVNGTAPYDTYDLGVPVAGVPGAGYKVCWASAPGATGGTNLYRVQAGDLTVHGPVQVAHSCTLGVECMINLTGSGLNASNKVLIIHSSSSCGDPSPTVAAFDGLQNPRGARGPADPSIFDMGTGGTTSSGVGSDYSLCWAHDPSSLEDYKVTVGVFSMYGPDPENLVQCTMGVSCTLEFSSTANLASTNQILLVATSDTCGESNPNVAPFTGFSNPAPVGSSNNEFPLGVATFGEPGDYKICWAHEPGGSLSDFNVDVGTFRMNGPTPTSKQCFLSEPCHIAASGVGLGQFSAVLIVAESDSCGQAGATVISWSGIDNPSATLGALTYYDAGMGSSGSPGSHKVCWGASPGGLGSEAYNVLIGVFTMNGPYQGVYLTCMLGQPCNLEIGGVGLSGTNSLQLVSDSCGSGATQVTMEGITNPRPVTDDATDTLYAMGLVTSGGSYGPCRSPSPPAECIGATYIVCWSHGVTLENNAVNHLVDIGTFAISGPYGDYSVECFIGQICAFSLYGAELGSSNQVRVIESQYSCGDASAGAVKLPGLRNPMRASDVLGTSATFRLGTLTGGRVTEHRLCWGGSPRVAAHYNVEIGPFRVRETPHGCEVRDRGLTVSCDVG